MSQLFGAERCAAATTEDFPAQGFDIRLPPSVDMAQFEEKIKEVRCAGGFAQVHKVD